MIKNTITLLFYTVKNEEFLELLELAIYSFVIVTNTPGSSNELQLLLDRVWVHIGVKFTASESVTLTFCTPTRLTVGVFLSTFGPFNS